MLQTALIDQDYTYRGGELKTFSAKEAIINAGLNWQVAKVPATLDSKPVPGYYFTVREDTGKVLGMVKGRYEVIQNTNLFDFLDPVIGQTGAHYKAAGTLRGGQVVWMLVQLPEEFYIVRDDRILQNILIASSHDGSLSCVMQHTPLRHICSNVLSYTFSYNSRYNKPRITVRHTKNAEFEIQAAHNIIGLASRNSSFLSELFNDLSRVPVNSKTLSEFSRYLFPSRLEEEGKPAATRTENRRELLMQGFSSQINNVPGAEYSGWTAYNTLTEFVDHRAPVRTRERRDNAWFGSGHDLKVKGLKWLSKNLLGRSNW